MIINFKFPVYDLDILIKASPNESLATALGRLFDTSLEVPKNKLRNIFCIINEKKPELFQKLSELGDLENEPILILNRTIDIDIQKILSELQLKEKKKTLEKINHKHSKIIQNAILYNPLNLKLKQNINSISLGQMNEDEINGKACIFYNNNDIFTGTIIDDIKTGNGSMLYKNGDVFFGEYFEDKFEGKGIFKWGEGPWNNDVYVGDFKDDKIHGEGVYIFGNKNVYIGDFDENQRSGDGIMIFNDGDFYQGEFFEGKFEGRGVYKFSNGDLFEGEWENNKRNGKGIMRYRNGKILEGVWMDDKRIDD